MCAWSAFLFHQVPAASFADSNILQTDALATVDSLGAAEVAGRRVMRSQASIQQDEDDASPFSDEQPGRDCVWNEWGAWKPCTKTCGGGITERLRTFVSAKGGVECDGPARDVQSCAPTACPEECVFSAWSAWSECNSFCGNGTSQRYRNLTGQPGNKKCLEEAKQERVCFGRLCDGARKDSLDPIGNGTQISGSIEIITEDPVLFAANPAIEKVIINAMTTFAMHPVKHVHVSLMPSVAGSSSRTVEVWFSMVVPPATNLTDVVKWLKKGHADLPQATRQLKSWMTTGGESANIMITKFTVTKIAKIVIPQMPNATNKTSVDWQMVNATRLTGVVKVVLPCEAVKFAMDGQTKSASETLIGEVVQGYTHALVKGVHASLIPDQVLKANMDSSEATWDKKEGALSNANVSGEVDVWFSVLGAQYSTRAEAVEKSKAACKALLSVDLQKISKALGSHLVGLDKCWSPPTVIFISCRAEDDNEDCHSAPKHVTGLIEMKTRAPLVFAADFRAEQAAKATIADLASVEPEKIRVNIVPEKTESTIYLPPVLLEADAASDQVPTTNASDAEEKVYAWFIINAPPKPLDSAEHIVSRLLDAEASLAELKLQNNLIKYGLDNNFVTVTKITAQLHEINKSAHKESTTLRPSTQPSTTGTTTHSSSNESSDLTLETTLAPVALNSTGGDLKATGGSDIIATAAKILRNGTVDSGPSPPAQVVAVVANVDPVSAGPPTLSNPGGGDEESDSLER